MVVPLKNGRKNLEIAGEGKAGETQKKRWKKEEEEVRRQEGW